MQPIPNWLDYFADRRVKIYSMKSWGKGGPPKHPRELKFTKNAQGYNCVALRRDGKTYTGRVGKLMLETFIGPCPAGMETCHGPNGRLDDSLGNLCWGTPSKNQGEDRVRDGTDVRGEECGMARLEKGQVLQARSLASKMPHEEIAKMLGVSVGCVRKIIYRERWVWLK